MPFTEYEQRGRGCDVAHVVVSWADTTTWSAKLELNVIDVARFSRIPSSSFCLWLFSLVSLRHTVALSPL